MYSLPKGAVGTLSGWVPLDNLTAQDDFEATLRGLLSHSRGQRCCSSRTALKFGGERSD
jgi:hypothetical protein